MAAPSLRTSPLDSVHVEAQELAVAAQNLAQIAPIRRLKPLSMGCFAFRLSWNNLDLGGAAIRGFFAAGCPLTRSRAVPMVRRLWAPCPERSANAHRDNHA